MAVASDVTAVIVDAINALTNAFKYNEKRGHEEPVLRLRCLRVARDGQEQ